MALGSSFNLDRIPPNESMLVELLKELKAAKEDASWAKAKLLEMVEMVQTNRHLDNTLTNNLPIPTHHPDANANNKKENIAPAPHRAQRYAADNNNINSSDKEKDSDDEGSYADDEYSNDFEASQSMAALPRSQPKPALTVPLHAPLHLPTVTSSQSSLDFRGLGYIRSVSSTSSSGLDLDNTLLSSQALFRRQLSGLRDRLAVASVARYGTVSSTVGSNSTVGTSSSLQALREEYERGRQDSAIRYAEMLRRIDSTMDAAR